MLTLSWDQILSFRRWIGGLEARVAASPASFRLAAWAGLQDSMPRAALLSLHARIQAVRGRRFWTTRPCRSLGPRDSVYVTAAWTVPAPQIDPAVARAELVRRYLHVFGPGTPLTFAKWAGINDRPATVALKSLSDELLAVRTPLGEAWILASDEEGFQAQRGAVAPARLLPSGDAYYLFWGADRALLVPDGTHQAELWTPRVWPGAVLVDGELASTWRRAQETVSMHLWKQPTRAARDTVEAEAAGLPIPGCEGQIRVVWE